MIRELDPLYVNPNA